IRSSDRDMSDTITLHSAPELESPEEADEERLETRLRPRAFQRADAYELVGAAFGSFCLCWLIYELITPLSGGLGVFITWYFLFLTATWFISRERLGRVEAFDRVARVAVVSVGIGVIIPLALIVIYTIGKGYHALRFGFFTQDQSEVGPLASATKGG